MPFCKGYKKKGKKHSRARCAQVESTELSQKGDDGAGQRWAGGGAPSQLHQPAQTLGEHRLARGQQLDIFEGWKLL